jgi:broad specificity phosphatase PhoE
MNGMPRAQLDNERRLRLDEPVSGGESWREAVGQVMSFLEELTKEQEGRRVVLIGHVATRWALDHLVHGQPLGELIDAPFDWREGWEYTLVTFAGEEARLRRRPDERRRESSRPSSDLSR